MSEQQPPETDLSTNVIERNRRWPGRVALVVSGAFLTGAPAGIYIWENLIGKPLPGAAAGELVCPSGEPVVGAWIEPNDHADRGWATWATEPGQSNRATFTASVPRSSAYSIHVGCGGTTQNWEHDNSSPGIAIGPMLMQITCVDHLGAKNGSCTAEALPIALPVISPAAGITP